MKYPNINILQWKIFKDLPIRTGITTKEGGFSKPPYRSFNLATHTGDSIVFVEKNRELLCKIVDIHPENYCYAIQVHGDHIETITDKNIQDKHIADGLFTTSSKPMLNIFVADCVPIAIFDSKKNIGGLCHCGWKGTYNQLLKKMITKLTEEYNSNLEDILIGIGPSIGACCYEVSQELYDKFSPQPKEGHIKNSKPYLNLKEINRNQALNLGINPKNIEVMNYCTSCSNDLFYSHRKEGEPAGRFSCYFKIIS